MCTFKLEAGVCHPIRRDITNECCVARKGCSESVTVWRVRTSIKCGSFGGATRWSSPRQTPCKAFGLTAPSVPTHTSTGMATTSIEEAMKARVAYNTKVILSTIFVSHGHVIQSCGFELAVSSSVTPYIFTFLSVASRGQSTQGQVTRNHAVPQTSQEKAGA